MECEECVRDSLVVAGILWCMSSVRLIIIMAVFPGAVEECVSRLFDLGSCFGSVRLFIRLDC